jgi:CBS domain-containing protein
VFEFSIAIATNEIDLVLTAFLKHRFQVFDGMRPGHFREEFAKQVRLGQNTVKNFLARGRHLFEHYILCAEHEVQNAVVCIVPSCHSFRDRIFDDRRPRFVEFQHDGLRISIIVKMIRSRSVAHIELHQAELHETVDWGQIAPFRLRYRSKAGIRSQPLEAAMRAHQIMTRSVITVTPNTTVAEAATTMLQRHVSGLPVVDTAGKLIGIISEGDFLRRGEIGTQRRRGRFLRFILGPGKEATDFVHENGRKIAEIMTPKPLTVSEDTDLEEIVELMERNHVKRLPVMRGDKLVGIVSRANLL